MRREKDLFEIETQMRKFQQKARRELRELTCKQQVERLLEKLEMLEKKHFEEISDNLEDEQLKEKAKRLLQETEAARKNLKEGNLYELKNYLEDVKTIIDSSGVSFPSERWSTSSVIAGEALYAVNDVIEYEEGEKDPEENLEGHTEELLKRIEAADKEELTQIQENLESGGQEEGFEVELEEKCRELWEETEKARENLKTGNYKKALNYVEQVGKVLRSIETDLDHIERLEDKFVIDEDNPIYGGKVFPLKNRNDLLIKFHVDLRDSKKLKKLIDQMPDEVNIMNIVEVGLYEGEPAEIIQRAPGRQIRHAENPDELISDIADAPQEHFDKLVRDSEIMIRYGLTPDASDNLFFSKEKGFIWIDPIIYDIADRREKGLDNERFNYFRQVVPKRYASNQKDIECARKIVSKLKKAGAPEPGKSLDESLRKFIEGRD